MKEPEYYYIDEQFLAGLKSEPDKWMLNDEKLKIIEQIYDSGNLKIDKKGRGVKFYRGYSKECNIALNFKTRNKWSAWIIFPSLSGVFDQGLGQIMAVKTLRCKNNIENIEATMQDIRYAVSEILN